MSIAASRVRCVTCSKEKVTYKCHGCSQDFCFDHLKNHRQELEQQLDEIEVTRDLFRQSITEQTKEPEKQALIQQINKWEHESINKIRQTAEEARQQILKYTAKHSTELEDKLSKLTNRIRESREEDDFFEADLLQWNEDLTRLKSELTQPSNITIKKDSTPFVNKISVNASVLQRIPATGTNSKWIQNGITVAGGNGSDNGAHQLSSPNGLYVDDDQTVYVAVYSNHRFVEWKKGVFSGQIVAGGNGNGNRTDQLQNPTNVIVDKKSDSLIICDYSNGRVVRWPRRNGTNGEIIISNVNCWGLAMDNDGYLYVSDISKHEVRRWRVGDTDGTVVSGGNGQGNRLDQLSNPYYIFVDGEHSVYVSDGSNHRVMKWMEGAKEGVVVAGGQGKGNSLAQLYNPRGVAVDQFGTVYMVDLSNNRIMRWLKGAAQGSIVVGGNGEGRQANQFNYPLGLSLDQEGNLYVADHNNYRIQKFNIDPSSNT